MPEQRIQFEAQLDDIRVNSYGPIDNAVLRLDLQLQLYAGSPANAAALAALLLAPGRWVKVTIDIGSTGKE